MLAVLDLFTEEHAVLSADEICARRKYTRPTGYRYVRELVAAGLLSRAPGGYALGARIIELDWVIRTQDPVLTASRDAVQKLAQGLGCDVTQMGLYGERIVTIRHQRGPEPLQIGFDRGRPMPLWRGAPSKAVLAFLPRARLERLYAKHHARGFPKFFKEMQAIRKSGYTVSFGELDPGKVGIGAPVFRRDRSVAGSLCLVLTQARYDAANRERLVERLLDAAARISEALEPVDGEPRGRRTGAVESAPSPTAAARP
jgi:DNA-binding IclR family transcriptional regulator